MWKARLWHGGKLHSLGSFAEERDAIDAVRVAREATVEGRLEQHLAERVLGFVDGVAWTGRGDFEDLPVGILEVDAFELVGLLIFRAAPRC